MVLLLDTARYKYPPHWVPLKLLYKAMRTRDSDSGLYRGYIIITIKPRAEHREYIKSAIER